MAGEKAPQLSPVVEAVGGLSDNEARKVLDRRQKLDFQKWNATMRRFDDLQPAADSPGAIVGPEPAKADAENFRKWEHATGGASFEPTEDDLAYRNWQKERTVIEQPETVSEDNPVSSESDTNERLKSLNEKAHEEIWGTNGVINSIRQNEEYDDEEKDTATRLYEGQVRQLTEAGFELTQAKLIQDLREIDRENATRFIAHLKANAGLTNDEANKVAEMRFWEIDANRQKFIKENNIYDMESYNQAAGKVQEQTGRRIEVQTDGGATDGSAVQEKEHSVEILTERDAINPENMLDLKKRYQSAVETAMAEMSEDKRDNPYLAQAAANSVFENLMHEYLKNIKDKEVYDRTRSTVGLAVLHIPEEHLSQWQLKPEDGKENQGAWPGENGKAPAETAVMTAVPEDNGRRFWRRRRNSKPSAVAVAHDQEGQPVVGAMTEEQAAQYRQLPKEERRRRRRLWPLLGALLAGAALGIGTWELFDHDGNSKPVAPPAATAKGGYVHTFNERQGDAGRRYVQVVTPGNLEFRLTPTPGHPHHETIYNKDTQQQIADVTYQANGALSPDTIQQLHAGGYDTRVGRNTINDRDGGPGPSGEVTARDTTFITPVATPEG